MYYFNKENIIECSESIKKKRYELEECRKRISVLVKNLGELTQTRAVRRQLKAIEQKITEETEWLDRLKYTLSYAVNTYTDSDRTGSKISSGNGRQAHKLVNKMLGSYGENQEIHLAVNIVMR